MDILDCADKCLKNLEHLENSSNETTLAFKHFVENFKLFMTKVEKCVQESYQKLENSVIILCLSQVKKVLPMLQNVIQENEEHGAKEKIWYLCERLQWCISELRRIFGDKIEVKDKNEDVAGSFVHHIDYALQILSQHECLSSNCHWKSLIDNLLCQALTIAKISNETDFKEISVICKKVLEGSTELLSPRSTLSKQMTESLAGDLVTLEQRVNTAVLRLVLQVFADSNRPIRNLVSTCGKRETTLRSASSLESLINEFDIHSDRIFHIGTFAMACSEDFKRIQGIKCCLASLESLDNYLVPALTAFYLDNQNPGKRAFIKFLTLHWQQEITVIQTMLDGIIDSTAFCQVCLEDISEKVENVKKNYTDRKSLDGDLLNSLVAVGQRLHRHLEYNNETMDVDLQLVQGISVALNECDAATKLYFSSHQSIDSKSIVKRCELLVINVQKMSKYFFEIVNSPSAISRSSAFNSVQNLPFDISENSKSPLDLNGATWIKNKYLNQFKEFKVAEQNAECNINMDELKPYLSCMTERNNTFYIKTPCKVKNSIPSPCVSIPQDNELTNGIDISEILDNLTSLSDTLSSIRTTHIDTSVKYKNNKSNITCTDYDSSSIKYNFTKYKILSCINSQMSSGSVKTEEVSDVNTPDRLQDLRSVETKIEMLKLGNV